MTDKTDRLAKTHEIAKKQFDKAQCAVADERQQCLEDRRFYSIAGAQWEGKLGEQFENKPKFGAPLNFHEIEEIVAQKAMKYPGQK